MSAEDINDLAKSGQLPRDPAAVAKPVSKRAKEVAEDEARVVSERELLHAGVESATRPRSAAGKLTTTHWEMDRDTGGFQAEQVWFVGGLSGFGKTSFTIACADEQIKAGRRPLIVSGEDPKKLYGERLLMRRTRVDRYRFAEGKCTADELSDMMTVAQAASNQPLYLEAIGKPVEWMVKRVGEMIRKDGIDMVYFDYVQCFNKSGASDGRRMDITHIARQLIDCIKTNGIAGAILSQITPNEKTDIPTKEMMRDSKDMGFFAEVVAMGFEAKNRIERSQDGQRVVIAEEGERCMVIDKNKPGPGPFSGRIYRMGSDVKHGCFDVVPNPMAAMDQYVDQLVEPYGGL